MPTVEELLEELPPKVTTADSLLATLPSKTTTAESLLASLPEKGVTLPERVVGGIKKFMPSLPTKETPLKPLLFPAKQLYAASAKGQELKEQSSRQIE